MCGIVGYVGKRQAYPILIKGLHRLEYRGYDSAGLALVNREGVLNVFKSKGKVADLEHFVESKDLDGTIGIAHTRWATHGEPNDINAHPHYSDSGNIALIHNGIIENYRVLKEALIENGYTFKSDTDTEVLVNLIEYIRTSNNCTLLEAVQQALKQVIGAYAIAVVEKGNQDQIIAARRSSPMVIGIGDKEMDIEKGGSAAEQIEYHGENYALQATALQASDLKNLKVDGNTYTFEVENATSPQTDKSTAMSRLTNDILTQSMVDSEIKNFISAAKINSAVIEYTNIKATVVIEDGNLKEFKYSYDGNVAELNIKVAFISVNGKGAMHVDGAYTNFVY